MSDVTQQTGVSYEAPTIENLGSLAELTLKTKYVSPKSDGLYLGVHGQPGLVPLNS